MMVSSRTRAETVLAPESALRMAAAPVALLHSALTVTSKHACVLESLDCATRRGVTVRFHATRFGAA